MPVQVTKPNCVVSTNFAPILVQRFIKQTSELVNTVSGEKKKYPAIINSQNRGYSKAAFVPSITCQTKRICSNLLFNVNDDQVFLIFIP